MNIKNIEEAEALIKKLKIVKSAKHAISEINADSDEYASSFVLIDKNTNVNIQLYDLQHVVIGAV